MLEMQPVENGQNQSPQGRQAQGLCRLPLPLPPASLCLAKVQCKLEEQEDRVCIPLPEKPKLFQICQQNKQEKVGVFLKGVPEHGLIWQDELEGLIALAP